MAKNNKSFFSGSSLWDKNSNNIWLASSVKLLRNIEKFKFPLKLAGERRKQIVTLLSKELLSAEELQTPKLFQANDLTSIQREYLVEHFLTNESYREAEEGEAFVMDKTGQFIASLNIRNHFTLNLIDNKGEIENCWNKLVKIETHLGKSINYSYSPKYGFLTADPTESGTALLVTAFLQLSGLIHLGTIDDVLENLADESLQITGIQGSPTEIIGDILMIQNNYTLGITEENILSSLRNFITKLMVEEQSARNKIRSEDSAAVKDKVSRAFGILIHSYQIEAIEALNAIALLKLGLEFDWIGGATMEEMNRLLFRCRRAHLLCEQEDEKVSQEVIPHLRAEFIHKTLKNLTLKI